MNLPLIGISSCLTGEKVRYDGGHRRQGFILEFLSGRAELLPVCPESECGMTVPREPMDLFLTRNGIRLLTVNGEKDMTDILDHWSLRMTEELAGRGVSGFILKSGSPSCGIGSARLHHGAELRRDGNGLFAARLLERLPGLPVAEERNILTRSNAETFLSEVQDYCGGLNC